VNLRRSGNRFKILFSERKKVLKHFEKQGSLVVVSAPSGAGKTTVVDALIRSLPNLKRSVSYTTRSPRAGEKSGVDYHFITRVHFFKKRKHGFFLEWANVFGKFYGTSKKACLDLISKNQDVLLTVDVQGMRKIRKQFSREIPMLTIFLMPPSITVLQKRLTKRKTDAPAEIKKRLRIAKAEIRARKEYDFTVVNRKVSQAVRDFKKILLKNKSS